MQARKLLLMRAPVKERKMLSRVAMPIITQQTKLHRRAGIKDVDVLRFDGVKHTVCLILGDSENDLYRLIFEPENMGRVMSTRMSRSFGTVDDGCAVNA